MSFSERQLIDVQLAFTLIRFGGILKSDDFVYRILQLFDDASGNGVIQITDRRCSKDFGSADHEGETFAFAKSPGVIRHGVPLVRSSAVQISTESHPKQAWRVLAQ